MHRMYSFTSLEGVWDTAGDSPLLCMRRGAPPGSHSKRLLVDLMTRQWEESCEWPDHIEFEDEMVCATHDGYLVSVTKNLVQRDCGLALHGTASEHPARSRPEGWPGDAFRIMAMPIPQGHHASVLGGAPRTPDRGLGREASPLDAEGGCDAEAPWFRHHPGASDD